MSFGKRLKEARGNKKMTQAEVASILGIDDTTISKYENDKSEPDNETLKKLSALYNVNIGFLIGKEINEKSAAEKLLGYLEMELSNEEIKERMIFKVDDITLSGEEVEEFVNWVRVNRAMKKERTAATSKSEGL